jgi:ElaB/YqjD/DUF883 family membrane-anchored ribosome-binding protein
MAGHVVNAAQRVVQLSHDARALESVADEAIEDGVRAARRAVRRGTAAPEDVGDEALYYVKRQPFKAITIAAGAGAIVGIVIGVLAGRATRTVKQ